MTQPYTTLIDARRLRDALASAEPPRVIDVRFDLADVGSGEAAYLGAHVPGSLYLHLDRDLCGPKSGANGRHPLPTRDAFARTLGRAGITPSTQIVALDAQGGMYAARLWWMLRWIGHDRVAVLDGGLKEVAFHIDAMRAGDLTTQPRAWGADEARQSRMVFIGIDLPRDILEQGLDQCLV